MAARKSTFSKAESREARASMASVSLTICGLEVVAYWADIWAERASSWAEICVVTKGMKDARPSENEEAIVWVRVSRAARSTRKGVQLCT